MNSQTNQSNLAHTINNKYVLQNMSGYNNVSCFNNKQKINIISLY